MTAESITEGSRLFGFTVRQVEPLTELNATFYRLEHDRTGARYIHLATADDNNLFAVGFRTPPRDSTGVAHILEHTALCGSRRYPVRDPFFSMIKRSLNSFMNAMTAADWTLYPFSSLNEKDFYNLLGVYLDAAFFPLLRERDFRQEGWRLEFADPADPASPLEYKGIVYNEMKGAMADPHSRLSQRMAEALFPTTTYGVNSGGEPAHIPDLTWEALRAFHATCYHPSNAYLFSSGHLPLLRHLEAVERLALGEFDRREIDTAVGDEKRFSSPQRCTAPCPIEPGEDPAGKAMVQLSWLNGPVTDSFERLSMTLLSALLLGNPASPLYKALLDSKLGTNLAPGTGYGDDGRETTFSAGLQGTETDHTDRIEALVLSTLAAIAEDGFSRERIDAAIHRLEFAHREVRGDHYPYALGLLSRLMEPWIHGGDPVKALSLTGDLERLRRELDAGPFFSQLIRTRLLENPHRVTLTLVPDPLLAENEEKALAARLAETESSLTAEARQDVVAQARALQASQEAVDDLSCLPTLGLSDIPGEERPVAWEEGKHGGVPFRWFDQPTNGIGYFTAHVDLSDLADELQPYLPLFCTLLTQVGAAGLPYTAMAERIEATTGGVGAGAALLERPDAAGSYRTLVHFSARALNRNISALFDVVRDVLLSPEFTDLERLHTVIGQVRANLENSIPNVGHRYAARAATAGLSPSGRIREQWGGVEHIRFVRTLAALAPDDLGPAAQRFRTLAALLADRTRLRCAWIGEKGSFPAVQEPVGRLLGALEPGGRGGDPWISAVAFRPTPVKRGFAASVPVCYVARVFPTVAYTHPDAPGLLVLAKLLRSGYLHREIREKGGAYGGMASCDPESGNLALLSYRDPHLARTLQVFDDAAAWAAKGEFTADEIKESVLGVFGDLDRPLSPSGKGEREFGSLEQGLTREMRQHQREGVLAAGRKGLAVLAERYLVEGRTGSSVAVVASDEALRKANQELGDEALTVERL